jgi:CMP/dCMP kinase
MTEIPKQGPVIALDGPAGSGKSTVTKKLAERLGFVHVDTGAIYRSIAYLVSQKGIQVEGLSEGSKEVLEAIEVARVAHLEFKRNESLSPANRVFANAEDITDRIRTPEISLMASKVSAIPEVRAALLELQRRLGCEGKTILEGRDIGTVVFQDADVKIFLTADPMERARRRHTELLEQQGSGKIQDIPSLEELFAQIELRDRGDRERAAAPLKKAEDAIELDTSCLDLDEVIAKVEAVVRERLGL